MRNRAIKLLFCVCICLVSGLSKGLGKTDTQARHISIAMRMVGHQLLLLAGDSTSRVLPVEKVDGRYKISFESDFSFHPEDIILSIDQLVMKSQISDGYLLEVESCKTGQVVYGYELGQVDSLDIIPCTGRPYPKDCYALFITLHESYSPFASLLTVPSLDGKSDSKSPHMNSVLMILMLMSPLFLIALGLYMWKKRSQPSIGPYQIAIGEYVFDQSKMELSIGSKTVELSGLETELLLFLRAHANTTLEREFILQSVWGDNGSYVGRTVDVYISKLRKKLQEDPNVRIVNIRGVGYKLIVNET